MQTLPPFSHDFFPFHLSGIVVPGAKRGRKVGMPTANLSIQENTSLPPLGVYASLVFISYPEPFAIQESSTKNSGAHDCGAQDLSEQDLNTQNKATSKFCTQPFQQEFSKHYPPKIYMGLTNIGKRPSVDSSNHLTIETYVLDFDEEIYGYELHLELHAYLRPTCKFNNLQEVKAQVNKDEATARALLEKRIPPSSPPFR